MPPIRSQLEVNPTDYSDRFLSEKLMHWSVGTRIFSSKQVSLMYDSDQLGFRAGLRSIV